MSFVNVAKCLHVCSSVDRFHGGSVLIFDVVSFRFRQSYHFAFASLSFYSAHVSVDPTVAVRITLN